MGLCIVLWLALMALHSSAFIVLVDDITPIGTPIFSAYLDGPSFYKIDPRRTSSHVHRILKVDERTGEVTIKKRLRCDGTYYSNPITLWIEAWSEKENSPIDYASIPLRVIVKGRKCPYTIKLEHETSSWKDTVSFSLPLPDPNPSDQSKLCLRASQVILRLTDLIPPTLSTCNVTFQEIPDLRFRIEPVATDLVSTGDLCLIGVTRVHITTTMVCHAHALPYKHDILLVLQSAVQTNDAAHIRRIRRQMQSASPYFERTLEVAQVIEESEIGTTVGSMTARDPEGAILSYSMEAVRDSRSQRIFQIDGASGLVTTKSRVDREQMDVHYFRVKAVDKNSSPPRSATTTLQINVEDANDHEPVFEKDEYVTSVRESITVGGVVITVRATDGDSGPNADIRYSILEPSGPNQVFRLDPISGELSTRLPLDRESQAKYVLTVQAEDQASPKDRKTTKANIYINVKDENDNYPQFSERTYTVEIPENINVASSPVIAHIQASDDDEGQNGQIRYAIIGGNTAGQFSIDGLTGEIRVISPLDHELLEHYRLVVRAQDSGSPPRSNTTKLLVNVRDINDNSPKFYTSLFQETVKENIEIGYSIVRVQAFDNDAGNNSLLSYRIENGGVDLPVEIDEITGWITTNRQVDREENHHYKFMIVASDHGDPPLSATATVVLQIQDENDNRPIFNPKTYEVTVSESDPPGTPVVSVSATDNDENQRIHYSIVSGNERNKFSITVQNGKGLLSLAQPLDYKQERRFVLTIAATDSGAKEDTATVYINVTDANTFPPVFENTPYSATIFEDAPVGSTVVVVVASDGDSGENARITYFFSGDSVPEFHIHPNTGAITTTKPLDRESQGGYLLTVTARDNGNPSQSDTTDVEITVVDVNDNNPTFAESSYRTSISEEASIGTSVAQVKASDADSRLNGRVTYSFDGGNDGRGVFTIDPTSGVIRTARPLDRESVASYELIAIASDSGAPERSSSVTVFVEVEDVNDNPPTFDTDRIQLYITENSPVGSTVGEIRARDPDEGKNAVIQYSIIGGPDAESFSMVAHPSEGRAELVTRTELDYESPKKKYQLKVRATSSPLRADIPVIIHVVDINDNAPTLVDFRVIFNNFKNHFPTGPIGKVPAVDADVTDQLSFRIISGNKAGLVDISTDTGDITLSPALNTNVPITATMEISVSDGLNEVSAEMNLQVRLVTDAMLYNSVTVRLADMTQEAFLSPLFDYFIDGLAAIIPCPRENIFIFNIMDDTDVDNRILNVSFSALKPNVQPETFYSQQFLKERVYLQRSTLAELGTVQVLPFDDNLCVREPCLNFEQCLTVLKFGNASGFISSRNILFRPIYPVNTFSCVCPKGFTGMNERYECDTEVDLCYSSPCGNHGTCLRSEGGYTCACLPGYTGHNCEFNMLSGHCMGGICARGSVCTELGPTLSGPKLVEGLGYVGSGGFTCTNCTRTRFHKSTCELTARRFTKGTFLTFPSLRHRHRFNFEISFATREPNGLLLYNGRYNERHDFVSLQIIDDVIVFTFSLGSDTTHVSASLPGGVSDGEWHTVKIDYYNRRATITLDNCDTALAVKFGDTLGNYFCANSSYQELEDRCSIQTESCHRFLDLTGPMQIGGLPSLPTTYQVQEQHFQGCIKDLTVDKKFIDMNSYVANNGTLPGCHEKNFFCRSHPCRNGGTCQETFGTYVCQCVSGWGGKDCNQVVEIIKQLNGDGYVIFSPQIESVSFPWYNSLSFRTREGFGLLMSVSIGSTTSILELVDGYIQFRYENTSIHITDTRVDNGEWHNIQAKWMQTEIWLSIDYGDYEITRRFQQKAAGQYVGTVSVGGVGHATDGNIIGFEGCIKDVRMGHNDSNWLTVAHEKSARDGCLSNDACSSHPCPRNSKCISQWNSYECRCDIGHYGKRCQSVCDLNPCSNDATCVLDKRTVKGYRCECSSRRFSGEYCETTVSLTCPASWWGNPVCGPCDCDVEKGYSPDCNKITGQCECETNHYQPKGSDVCYPCDCYYVGSMGGSCDPVSGQCNCQKGVIGRRCDKCSNPFAEVTSGGCKTVYNGCPKNFADEVWWDSIKFGSMTVQDCPRGTQGQGSRRCLPITGWEEPDMFDCVSDSFALLRDTLGQLEEGTLEITTFVAIKLSEDLNYACSVTPSMWGSDVLIASRLIILMLEYETQQEGLNLTHRQDKHYIQNLVESASMILQNSYVSLWQRINGLKGFGADTLLSRMDEYVATLASSQGDTYTTPFEIPTENIVFGMDTVSSDEIYGYLASSYVAGHQDEVSQVIVPENNQMVDIKYPGKGYSAVIVPKYNNYLQNQQKWTHETNIRIPLSLIDIPDVPKGEVVSSSSVGSTKGVVSYVIFRSLGMLLPPSYSRNVEQRWGVGLTARSPLFTVAVYTNKAGIIHKKLDTTVRLRFRMGRLSHKANPQCVTWVVEDEENGVWTREGCQTSYPYPGEGIWSNDTFVNCTCDHLSSFGVILNDIEAELLAQPSVAEDVTTYFSLILSLVLLLISFIAFSILRGASTNSNTIHKNITACFFIVQMLYLIALKKRNFLINEEFPCKLMAIGLHYFWVSVFTWLMIEGFHLYRMLTEMRDVNHGQMRFYYAIGYGLPGLIVGLSVGVKVEEYGNILFCWLSIHESVAWAMVGPICCIVFMVLCIFVFALRASLTLKGHVEGFGNLRTLLWLGILFIPLLGATWVLAMLSASENTEILHYFFSLFSFLTSLYVLIGYCLLNARVRDSLYFLYLRCMGRKLPYKETVSVMKQPPNTRSAISYNDDFNILRRNIGISTASTTSRSTCKTSSSPYSRGDGISEHCPVPSSSTPSNYNSNTDLNSQSVKSIKSPYAYNDSTTFHRKNGRRTRNESDSESDISVDRLELASSHSSDDDTTTHNGTLRVHDSRQSNQNLNQQAPYAPNIAPMDQRIDESHERLNESRNSVRPPIYAQHWSSQLPPSNPDLYNKDNSLPSPMWIERLSTTTASDNELSDKPDNLRVESRPTLSRYMDQTRNRYSPPENQYGTYSPSSKPRFSPDPKKFSTLDSRRYSPDTRRFSPDTRGFIPDINPYSPDNKLYSPKAYDPKLNISNVSHGYDTKKVSSENLYGRETQSPHQEFSPDSKPFHPENILNRPDSRTSRGSVESSYSDRRRYIHQENPYVSRYKRTSPVPTQPTIPEGVSSHGQKRFLQNLVEDPSPEELPAPNIMPIQNFSSPKGEVNNLSMTHQLHSAIPQGYSLSQKIAAMNTGVSDSEYV